MMMQRQQLLFLGTLLLILTAGAHAGRIKGATHKYGGGRRRLKKKKIHGPKHRTCTSSSKDQEVKFECKTKTGGGRSSSRSKDSKDEDELQGEDRGISIVPDAEIKDKIKYKVKTSNDGISVKLEYKNEIEMDDTETETKTKFELFFTELIEYYKGGSTAEDATAADQAYNWQEDDDIIVQSIPLTDWEDISSIVDDNDGIISYFTATTEPFGSDEESTVDFNFTISRADQGEQITANSMKIDVRISNFPWLRNDSYVALLSTLESEKKVKVEYDNEAIASSSGNGKGKGKKAKDVFISFGDEDMESTFGFSTYGEYTWAQEADATGMEVVNVTTTDDSSGFNGTVMMARQTGTDPSIIPVPEVLLQEDNEVTRTIEVIATSPDQGDQDQKDEDDHVKSIAYSFVGIGAQGASDIYWDPQAGIGYESGGVLGQGFWSMGLVGTALMALYYSLMMVVA